ncbi:MAG: hypothetical protein F6J98_10885 [Moorea sp. SIO4G2]|nr:hypothetical protein [Moorena sp. SIO4G2]
MLLTLNKNLPISPSPHTPDSRLPTPDSRLPTPDSRLPVPYSLLPFIYYELAD